MKHPTLGQTIILMKFFHYGQVDKGGKAYEQHPMRVMVRLGPGDTPIHHAALLHDAVEDTSATLPMLEVLGYSKETIDLVDGMTRRNSTKFTDNPPETYNEYIQRILNSGSGALIRLKIADCHDNASPSRTASLPDAEKGLEKRYLKTITRLEELYPDHGVTSGDLSFQDEMITQLMLD